MYDSTYRQYEFRFESFYLLRFKDYKTQSVWTSLSELEKNKHYFYKIVKISICLPEPITYQDLKHSV